MTYKTSLDKTAVIVTIAITVLFAGIICWQIALIKNAGKAVPIFITSCCLLIYIIVFAYRPMGYMVTKNELIIRRPLSDIHIKRSDITDIQELNRSDVSKSNRTLGVGGLFGYYGKFSNFSIGDMTWYVTRLDKPVLITTVEKKKIILSPDDPAKFISEFSL